MNNKKQFYEAEAYTVSGKKIKITTFYSHSSDAWGIAYARAKTTTKNFEQDPVKKINLFRVR